MKNIAIIAISVLIGVISCKKEVDPPPEASASVAVSKDASYEDQVVTGEKNNYLIGSWSVSVSKAPADFRGAVITVSADTISRVKNLYLKIVGVGIDETSPKIVQPIAAENDMYHSGLTLPVGTYRFRAYADLSPKVSVKTKLKVVHQTSSGTLVSNNADGQSVVVK